MRKVLFITPDYVSHFNPLIPIGQEFVRAEYAVAVATGPALRQYVEALGFEHIELVLGEESNTGLINKKRREAIRQSLDATRTGWYATLTDQAQGRVAAFLWNADQVAARTRLIVEQHRPVCVVAVQLTFAATAALLALNIPFATFVTGHPSQLPAVGEIYGFPYKMPSVFRPTQWELRRLQELCKSVQDAFTTAFNSLLQRINPKAEPLSNGLAAASRRLVLFNYPPDLMHKRTFDPPMRTVFIGASVRRESLDPELKRWFRDVRSDLLTVYFTFGSYFSVHTDILRRIVDALRREPVRVLLASGLTKAADLQPLPDHWLVRQYFPQAALLPHCDLVICHGGNNTVTEAFASGLPVVVAPFASDQFGSAASVEDHALGAVFDPNHSSVEVIRSAVRDGLAAHNRVVALGARVKALNGPGLVVRLCEEIFDLR